MLFNPLPHYKILDVTKLKVYADNKLSICKQQMLLKLLFLSLIK